MIKEKQIRKPILYNYKTDRFNALINNYVYKHIVYILLLKKFYKINKFNIFEELKKTNYFYIFNTIEEFHKDKFYQEQIKEVLVFYYMFITNEIENLELDKFYFLSYANVVEKIPIKIPICEWNYKNITQLKSEYLTRDNIKDIKELLRFKLNNLPEPKSFPIFEQLDIDISYDEYLIEITTKNTINFVPSAKKLKERNKENNKKGIIINPRFELLEIINLN